jgi:hypothetical protein
MLSVLLIYIIILLDSAISFDWLVGPVFPFAFIFVIAAAFAAFAAVVVVVDSVVVVVAVDELYYHSQDTKILNLCLLL